MVKTCCKFRISQDFNITLIPVLDYVKYSLQGADEILIVLQDEDLDSKLYFYQAYTHIDGVEETNFFLIWSVNRLPWVKTARKLF